MKLLLIMGFVLVLFFLLILFSNLHIELRAKRKGSDDYIRIRLNMWFGLIRFQKEYSFLDLSKQLSVEYRTTTEVKSSPIAEDQSAFSLSELPQLNRKLKRFLQRVHHLKRIMKFFLGRVYVQKIVWHTGIGSGEAAETGTLTGLVWGMKTSLIGLLSTQVILQSTPDLYVQPYFNEKKFETEFEGMFRFRIGYAILAGIRILLNLRKRRDNSWQNTLFRA